MSKTRGTVIWVTDSGDGRIESDSGSNADFDLKDIQGGVALEVGDKVEYEEEESGKKRGYDARKIRKV